MEFCLGSGVGKARLAVGNMSIKAVIAKNRGNVKQNLQTLCNTRLGTVLDLADLVSDGIIASIECI